MRNMIKAVSAAKFPWRGHLFGACHGTIEGCACCGSSAMVTDLQIKVEKYETKAAKCEESARRAPDEPERAFYQELANYYGAVATNFRQVIEKRKAA